MTPLVHLVGQATRAPHALRFARAVRAPERAQADLLLALLAKNRDTAYGRAHGFAGISTPAEYAARVPLLGPAELAPWVERSMKGERNLLTAEAPVFYGRSTGTSGVHKHVPITPSYRAEFQHTVNAAFWHLYLRFPRAFTGRFLYFVGPRRIAVAEDGCDIGSMSGYNFTEQPPLVRSLYAWPYELFEVADLKTRAYLALHQAITGDISLITGVFPLPIVYLLRDLETHAGALARDLRNGTLDGAPGLNRQERKFFSRGLVPRPDLAARLERADRAPVEEKASEAFPSLALCYCWTTATAGLYVPELIRRLGPRVAVRDAIYAATEGWCNVTIGDEAPGGPLAVTSVYFEFLPEEALGGGSATRTLTLSELEDGRRYALVLSNSAGLYRYCLGDIVEVVGKHHRTPRILFVRKVGASSNLAGELLDESHVVRAMSGALGELGLEATWFALVADAAGALPGYSLHVELAPAHLGRGTPLLATLGEKVEAALGKLAYSYGDLRGEGQLRALTVARVPIGSYERWRQARVAGGSGEAQLKATHLVPAGARLPEELGAVEA